MENLPSGLPSDANVKSKRPGSNKENGDKGRSILHMNAEKQLKDGSSIRRKVLADRNLFPLSEDHVKKYPQKGSINHENPAAPRSDLQTYHPLTNCCLPRPKFLRYNPDRRREFLLQTEKQLCGAAGEGGSVITVRDHLGNGYDNPYQDSSLCSPKTDTSRDLPCGCAEELDLGQVDCRETLEDVEEEYVTSGKRRFIRTLVCRSFLLLGVLFLLSCCRFARDSSQAFREFQCPRGNDLLDYVLAKSLLCDPILGLSNRVEDGIGLAVDRPAEASEMEGSPQIKKAVGEETMEFQLQTAYFGDNGDRDTNVASEKSDMCGGSQELVHSSGKILPRENAVDLASSGIIDPEEIMPTNLPVLFGDSDNSDSNAASERSNLGSWVMENSQQLLDSSCTISSHEITSNSVSSGAIDSDRLNVDSMSIALGNGIVHGGIEVDLHGFGREDPSMVMMNSTIEYFEQTQCQQEETELENAPAQFWPTNWKMHATSWVSPKFAIATLLIALGISMSAISGALMYRSSRRSHKKNRLPSSPSGASEAEKSLLPLSKTCSYALTNPPKVEMLGEFSVGVGNHQRRNSSREDFVSSSEHPSRSSSTSVDEDDGKKRRRKEKDQGQQQSGSLVTPLRRSSRIRRQNM